MSGIEFSEYNGKQWVFFKGKYLQDVDNSKMFISDDTEKVLEDCINSCAKNDKCQWFVWSTEGGKCKQYQFLDNSDSTFQWRYDSNTFQGKQLTKDVFGNDHNTETQEQCINDCYNDTNCVAVNYVASDKTCRVFYNYSNDNYYFGYYVNSPNGQPVGGETVSKGDNIYSTEASIEKGGMSPFIIFLISFVIVAVILLFGYLYLKNKKKQEKDNENNQSSS